jgi:hypothetical protein
MPCLLLQISDTEGSLSRTFLSPAHRRAAGRVSSIGTCVSCGAYSTALCAVMAPCSCGHQAINNQLLPLTCSSCCLLQLRRWMAAAGMRTWADQMANVHGRVQGAGEVRQQQLELGLKPAGSSRAVKQPGRSSEFFGTHLKPAAPCRHLPPATHTGLPSRRPIPPLAAASVAVCLQTRVRRC